MVPVTIQGVSFSYGATPVLDGVSLDIAAGELFFLLGASGCGKTTLLRLVAGFERPGAGVIRFGGADVTALPTERRNLGVVFQNYCLWPHLDVAGNVAFGLEMQRVGGHERAGRIDAALAAVGLAGYGARKVGELSGGQQQRVALARAVVTRPQVLLLDEPLSNLDARLRQDMRGEIRRICKQSGTTAIYVTHDQAEALATADRLAVMVGGRVAQVGTPRECYARPVDAAVARFLGEANLLDRAAAQRLTGRAAGELHCLRPEKIRLLPVGAPGLAGTVVDGSYQGDRAQWTVEAAGLRLTVVEPDPPERLAGDAVTVAIAPDDLVLVRP